MNAIAAVDKNWGIGKDNHLLFSIPGDMKFFRETTSGHVIVMGRKTLESFPGGRPLKNRINIVFTKDENYKKEGIITVHSVEELKKKIEDFDTKGVFVIGGGSIYELLISLCDTAFITKIDSAADADVYFPNLDDKPDWHIESKSETHEHEGLTYSFYTYKRK